MVNSPANLMFGTKRYELKIACPQIYTMADNVKKPIIEGTVANRQVHLLN